MIHTIRQQHHNMKTTQTYYSNKHKRHTHPHKATLVSSDIKPYTQNFPVSEPITTLRAVSYTHLLVKRAVNYKPVGRRSVCWPWKRTLQVTTELAVVYTVE